MQFASAELQSQRDALTYMVIFLVLASLVYALTVFINDILSTLKPNCCVSKETQKKKKIVTEEHLTGTKEKRPELQQNPLFHAQKVTACWR